MPQRHNSRLGKRSGFNRVEDLEARHCLAGLVAAFGFDEGSGATAQDASLFNHSGAISGATWTTSGRFGGALSFDGVNDLVTVADHASLDLTTAMTLEAWVRPTNINGWETVLLKEAGTDLAYSIYADNNGNDSGGPRRPAAWIRQGSTSYSTAGAAQLPLNTWTHLASTYDGATLRLFVNGTQVSSLARSGAVNTSTGALRIGGNTIWSEWFQGEIDELRIYDRVLSAAEIQADMNTAITPAVDVVPPTVLSTTPSHGATGVAVNSAMTITFSEPMDAATIHTGTITLVDAVDMPISGSVTYDPATRTASLTPLSPLAPGAAYTLTIQGGAAAPQCTDVAGNPLGNDVTVAFTTAPLAISISDVSVTEGNSGEVQAVFLVSLSAASASPVTVNYATTNGEAAGGADYIAQSTTELRFEPGQLSQTIAVRVIGDTVGEANETFFVDLSAPNGAVLADARGVGTILDDDGVLLGSEGFGYTAYTHTFEPLDLVPGANGVITVRATGNNNASQVTLPAGNSFNYYGVSFTSFHVSTNGLITFGTAVTSANNTNLTSSPSQRAIAPLWDDWLNTTGNAILLAKYEDLTGDGVNDRLILEWNNVQGSTSSPSPVTFQTILELNTGARAGAITFNYVDLDSGNARSDGASSTVGIKDIGTQGARRLLISQNAVNPNIASGKAIRILPDAIAPSVSLTAPADGATLTGVVTVSASAADNVGVVGVQFLLDGVPLGSEDISAPYSIAWDTSTVTSGFHVLSARARDAQGNTSTAPLSNVTVVPRLIITSPAAGAVVQGDTVNITYTTAGNLSGVAVHHVHFSLDGGPEIMDVDFDGSRQLTNISPGTHTLTGILVRADHSDILGTEAVPVTFTVTASDTTAPTVAVTSPIDGSNVTGNVVLAASASDDVGVAGVQFLVDGVAVGAEVTAAPYVLSWNSSTVAAGAHTITARARDAAGNVTTSTSVSVNVINANDPALIGQWSSPVDLPLVAINMTLLHDGRVLMWDGGPECIGSTSARVWDPVSGVTTPVPIPYFSHQDDDIFCSAQVLLPDGRVMVIGGHDCDGPHLGIAMVNFFDPRTMTWTRGPDMDFRRWYPTATLLANGKVLVTGGSVFTTTDYVPIPELYDPVTNTWTRLDAANAVIPNYAFMFQMPDGRMLAAGSDEAKMATRILDLNTQTWSTVDPTILDAGSAVMYLPGKVMKTGSSYLSPPADNGGSVPSAATTYVLDMTAPSPAWQQTESMEFPRTHLNLTILPDGTVLATGGSTDIGGVNPANAVYAAELWDPATQTWATLSSAQVPRLYHSTATLLPDGRVVSAGGGHNYFNNIAYPNAEFFSPPYLFKGARPAVTSAPDVLNYSANFFVATPDAADIAKVSLIRNGSVTHAFNMDQRYVPLSFSTASGGLNITAPADANLAPPGTYMLFLVNSQGVPSIASFVNLPTTPADVTPPLPPTNLVANGGPGVVQLSWTASTDNVAVTGYSVYRSATPSFTPTPANRIGQTISTSFNDSSGTGTYYYRVTAFDAAGNESVAGAEVSGTFAATEIRNVQTRANGFEFSTAGISLAFPAPVTAGNFLVVTGTAARPSQTITVSDSVGNVYVPAMGPINDPNQDVTAYVWYVANAIGGPTTVQLTPTQGEHAMEIHISEWAGVDGQNPLDQTAWATGFGTSITTETRTPSSNGSLVFGYSFSNRNSTEGAGFNRLSYINGDLDEYLVQTVAQPVAVTFSQPQNDYWFAMMAIFRPEVVDVIAPSAPSNVTAVGAVGRVDLSWTASIDNVGVARYDVHRSQTSGFTPSAVTRIGTSTTTAYADFPAPGSYYYVIVAADSTGNLSVPSNEASATSTTDVSSPNVVISAPTPGATVSGTVSVSATATDNVAVAGVQFLLNGNPLGAEDTTAPYAFSWNTATVANGVYSLSARARDAAGNSTTSASIDVTVSNVAISGLVSAYDFNAGAGASAVDATGNGFNAQISGATWTTDGRFGNALAFNGLNSVLTVNDANALDLTNGMTLEAWVKPAALNDWKTVLLKERPGGLAYALYASDGASRPPAGYINRSGADVSAIGTSTLPLNAWTHLAVTYDASALRLYVNGTQVATRSQTGNITTSTGALRIGGNSVWGEYFNGVIDEVRIYNRALTATEIQTDMNAPIGGAAPLTSAATAGDWEAAGAARLLREQSTDYLFTSEAFSPQIPIAPSTASTSFDRVKNIRRDAVSPAVRPRTANSLSPPGAHSRLADTLGESRATAPTWRADQTLVFESFFELLEMSDAQSALTSTLKKQ